jgi:hypothetical protein
MKRFYSLVGHSSVNSSAMIFYASDSRHVYLLSYCVHIQTAKQSKSMGPAVTQHSIPSLKD